MLPIKELGPHDKYECVNNKMVRPLIRIKERWFEIKYNTERVAWGNYFHFIQRVWTVQKYLKVVNWGGGHLAKKINI